MTANTEDIKHMGAALALARQEYNVVVLQRMLRLSHATMKVKHQPAPKLL